MRTALRAGLSVAVFKEVLEYARLAESVETLIDRVCVPEESPTERALQKRIEVAFANLLDQFCLLMQNILTSFFGLLLHVEHFLQSGLVLPGLFFHD